ncbi:aminotransferase class IV, partial [Leucobacter sp. M11]|uniref:aminotransferase class IV n=1 Tax=Leucobacter sp. M11 TaxID=2993565 RepID=UPI002D7F83BD
AGHVRGYDRHRARFADTVTEVFAEQGRTPPDLATFFAAAAGPLWQLENGFPRFELCPAAEGPALALRLRPAPRVTGEVAVRTAAADPRVTPTRKGPNIAAMSTLGTALGAEPILLDPQGGVIEGGTTSLLWWRDDVLFFVENGSRVRSVAEQLVRLVADELGIETAPGRATPEELLGRETWAVNALHGIRPVEQFDGTRMIPVNEPRLALFREFLNRTWQPVTRAPDAPGSPSDGAGPLSPRRAPSA